MLKVLGDCVEKGSYNETLPRGIPDLEIVRWTATSGKTYVFVGYFAMPPSYRDFYETDIVWLVTIFSLFGWPL
jgi:hypothetical protein